MIHVAPVPEPGDFDVRARRPGLRWLEEHPDAKRPRDYWTPFRPALAEGFLSLCGYCAMFEPVGSVDHYDSERSLAYEWDNYRFASAWINSSKQRADTQVLDPYEVEDGWFDLHLPSLQLRVTDSVPEELRAKAEHTLDRLNLRDDERVLRQRREWYRMYQDGELTLGGLREKAPLIAGAVEKQQAENA